MAKNLIIFGAGASYGSDVDSITPPLGANLFDGLVSYNPNGWGQINGKLANDFKVDFEAGIVKLSQQNSHSLPVLQRVMAAYFFNFVPRSTNLYYLLAKKISETNWSGALVTLNYERLLELSLSAADIQPYIGSPPLNNIKALELCLPHGCCHLFCESVRGSAGMISFAGMNVSTNGPIKAIGDSLEFKQRIQSDAFPPVMSYFEPDKHTTSGNNFILAQRQRFSELILEANTIILVGIHVREYDRHVWTPLASTKAKLVYLSGQKAGEEFFAWKNKCRKNEQDVIVSCYFKEGFSDLLKYVDLN